MTAPQIFTFQGSGVRTVIREGAPWFVARDACSILDQPNASQVVGRLDEDERAIHNLDTPSGVQAALVVSEAGLYSLILTSRKPEAKAFKRWITHEVLPAIRNTGGYGVQQLVPRTLPEALRMAADLAEKVEVQAATIQVLEPKASFHDQVHGAQGEQSIGEVAKVLGTGQNRLFAWLRGQHILMPNNQPYQEHIDCGRFRMVETPWTDRGGQPHLALKTTVTGKGLTWLQRRWAEQHRLPGVG